MAKTLPTPAAPAQDVTRGVLAIKPFRKLWNSMLFSSLGDWLGLLATTAMAQQLSGGDYATANFAIAGVFRSPQVNGQLRHLARWALHIHSNRKQLLLVIYRHNFG